MDIVFQITDYSCRTVKSIIKDQKEYGTAVNLLRATVFKNWLTVSWRENALWESGKVKDTVNKMSWHLSFSLPEGMWETVNLTWKWFLWSETWTLIQVFSHETKQNVWDKPDIVHHQKQTISVVKHDSGSITLRGDAYLLLDLYGLWGFVVKLMQQKIQILE